MNPFIDSAGRKNMKLLKLLLAEERYFSVKELTSLINMTTKTVKKLILLVCSDIQKGLYQVDILSQPRKGIKLANVSPFFFAEMEQFYIEKSICYQIVDQVFHGEYESAMVFSNTNFMSLSSFYKSLKEVRWILESFKMGATVSFPEKLEGQEKQYRYFHFHFYWQAFKGMKWPFKEYDRTVAEASLAEIEKILGVTYSIPEKEMLYYWLAIIFQRVKTGNALKKKELFFDNSTIHLNLICLVQSWFSEFEEDYVSGQCLDNEVQFLYLVLCGVPNYDTSIANKLNEKLSIQIDKLEMQSWILFFMKELNIFFLTPLSESEKNFIVNKLSIAHFSWNLFGTGKYSIQEIVHQNKDDSQDILEKNFQKGQIKNLISNTFFCDNEKKHYYEFLISHLFDLKKDENLAVTIYLTTNLEERKEQLKRIEIKQFLGNSVRFTQGISSQPDIILTDSNYMTIKEDMKKYQISSIPYEEKEFIHLGKLVKRIKELKNKMKIS
ncbi:MAG: helix-turn-helix domain-containing protein [Carnobacterium sp.]|uniref:helix-turn-helix domain-containing protein n=1 Tax=Carnobacterium sp. TaxID=48221 RepID=UPI002580BD85|nr:helix-turn-helix domain-containing protein [Carnobacterium sp.]MBQ6485355.1 helix-turn-helix domain-containing protein [Carnobacterium sp.]